MTSMLQIRDFPSMSVNFSIFFYYSLSRKFVGSKDGDMR